MKQEPGSGANTPTEIGPYQAGLCFTTEKGPRKLPILPPIRNLTLLAAPFTHSSALPSNTPRTNLNCYENLEFLGDAYIEIVATRLIHRSFPDLSTGQWAKLREALVCNDTLAKFSRAYGFDKQLRITQQERESAKTFVKILADVFEAYVAAIMLSDPQHGFAILEGWLCELLQPIVDEWLEKGGKVAHFEHINLDAKSDLNKLICVPGAKIEYLEEKVAILSKKGQEHKCFVGAFFTGLGFKKFRLGGAEGRSKAVAGMAAAKDALVNNAEVIAELHRRKVAYDQILKTQYRAERKKRQRERQAARLEEMTGNVTAFWIAFLKSRALLAYIPLRWHL